MALKVKELSEVYDMQVYTDQGDYFGDIEETVLTTNKVFGWRKTLLVVSTVSSISPK